MPPQKKPTPPTRSPSPPPKHKTPTPLQSPKKTSPPKESTQEYYMSDDNSNDATVTRKRKVDWRTTKFSEDICKAQRFDTKIIETLIQTWLNPFRTLVDKDYVPHLTYSEPQTDIYWDIPLSPMLISFKSLRNLILQSQTTA